MRHIKARRRFKAILAVLLIVCSLLFFESRIEAFAPQFKTLAENQAVEFEVQQSEKGPRATNVKKL